MKIVFIGLILVLTVSVRLAAQDETALQSVKTPAEAAQEQLDAYNARNIGAFLVAFSEDVQVFNFPNELSMEGRSEMRRRYAPYFTNTPDLHVTVTKRMVQGDYVIDKEEGTANGNKFSAVAIYHVDPASGEIDKVWFIQ